MQLRADVEVKLSESEGKLYDPLFDRNITLGKISTDVLKQLDDTRTLDEVAAHSGHSRADVDDALRTLLHLNLIEGSGANVLARARGVKSGNQKLGRVLLAESRFACQGSGDCCQSYHFGPLSDADIVLLDSLPIAEAFPHLKVPYIYEREMPGAPEGASGPKMGRFLNSINNRCQFLEGDCRCGLHARFGYASKPGLCRYYPFEQFATLDGIQLYDKGGCSRFAVSARTGQTLVEQLDEIGPLMPPSPNVHHPVVLIDASTPVDFGYLQPILRVAVDELEKPPAGAPEMLRAYARRTRALVQALSNCAVEPGGATSAVDELVARGPQPFLAPASEEAFRRGAAAQARLLAAFAHAVTMIITYEHHQSGEYYSGRQSKEIFPILHLAEEVASHLADPQFPLSDYAREVAEVSVDVPDADDVLRLSLRNQLFGHGALLEDRVVPAQLRLALVQIVSLWGARLSAVREGRDQVAADDLSRAHMLAMRVPSWTSVRNVFLEEEGELTALVEALPELVRWRPTALSGTMTK